MSQTRTFVCEVGTVLRKTSTGAIQGSGNSRNLYVGKIGSNQYVSLLKFTHNWANVGRLIRAELVLYGDDQLGLNTGYATTDTPKVRVAINKTAFTEGAQSNGVFNTTGIVASDFTDFYAGFRIAYKDMSKVVDAVNRIDITNALRYIAPATVEGGSAKTNHGFLLYGTSDGTDVWSGWSEQAVTAGLRPVIEIEFEYKSTVPSAPDNPQYLAGNFEADFLDVNSDDYPKTADIEVYPGSATNTGQTVTGSRIWPAGAGYSPIVMSASERTAKAMSQAPDTLVLASETTYKFRCRFTDNENLTGPWTDLVSFSIPNIAPDAPTLSPLNGSYDSLAGVRFRGTGYADDDGDALRAFQVQLQTAADVVLWDTGKVFVAPGADSFDIPYGGPALDIGSYTWRARWYDAREGVSTWTETDIDITADFVITPGTQPRVTINPQVPWRIRIMEMKFNALTGTLGTITGEADTELFTTQNNHGLLVGRKVRFSSLSGGTGLAVGTDYWVKTVPGVKTFTLATDSGLGTTVAFSTDVTAAVLTAITTRGPGDVVAILENAKSVGATKMYNSPGELHFTLPVDHPQISAIEPKQTHYGVDVYSGDGWREVFAGLMWDYDATETSAVFYGIDYLGLLDYMYDERFDPARPELATPTGSKYVNRTIDYIIDDQLDRYIAQSNSIIGFISVGTVQSMGSTLSIHSTMANALQFISGLLDSNRQGRNKSSRISVDRTSAGGYEFNVMDDPGTTRDDLRLTYGELVQGYRVVPFGTNWASTQHGIGRNREGLRVMYQTVVAPTIDQYVWGNIQQVQVFDDLADENDFIRRMKQAGLHAGKLGKTMALGIRSGIIGPLDGYDITDHLPISIEHGIVSTDAMGSGYWTIYGIAWETQDNGETNTTFTLQPRDDDSAPDAELIATAPLSLQLEWQIGWEDPNPLSTSSRYFLNQTTGIAYYRDDDDDLYYPIDSVGGTTNPEDPTAPAAPDVGSVLVVDDEGHILVELSVIP